MSKFTGSKKHVLALNTFVKLVRSTTLVCSDVHNHFLSELTVSQFGILEALYHLGPMSQKELASKILKSPGNITTIINNLERNELVRRKVNSEDKRYYTVHLTDNGRSMIERLFPTHAD
ncbi:MAG: MarR family transcriptional regulator, partial [Proteobacteria bacterium]|nr:MarR family transcriptional regulator [Pseudomonadota bacterium]